MELRTERLRLRPPDRTRDLADIVAGVSDPDVVRFIPTMPTPYTAADAEAWFARVEAGWEDGDEKSFVIVDALSDAFLGVVTVRLREGGSVGYWLAPQARGRGVMTEAVRAVVRWAHAGEGVRHLVLTTHPANTASQHVAERAGFVRAGMLSHDPPLRGGRTESVLYDWRP